MKIEVCVVNLGNGKYVYGCIDSLEDLAGLEKKVNPFDMNDTEVQLMDTDLDISEKHIIEFLRLKEEFNIDPEELAALFKIGTAQEAKEIIEYGDSYQFIEACNKETAFQEYYEDLNSDIPEHLKEYIDWNKLMRGYEHGGLTIENLGPGKHMLTDKFIIIQSR